MGWFADDAPRHEGYVVGLEPGTERDPWPRELHGEASKHFPEGCPVRVVQVGCDCGWRSSRRVAPPRAEWFPSVVELNDERAEEAARAIWAEHVESERRGPTARVYLPPEVR